jgi:gliding motility-associated-like protein
MRFSAKHWFSSFLLFLISVSTFSQSVTITDADYTGVNLLDCSVFSSGATPNFYDDGGTGANYSDNFNDTLVICPDLALGSKVTVAFGINAGFAWNVDSTDSIYVYDGSSTAAPLLGVHNSITDPNGFNHQASFFNNPSGCLTIVFISDTAANGTGWDANVTCGNPAQPFVPHMQGFENGVGNGDTLFPADTGIVAICPGDSVLFVGSADFPFALENTGTGYSQTDTNVTYKWFFSNGQILFGDSVWFVPPSNAGYVVTLQISDQFPNAEQLISSVRVAPRIDFSATRALNDSICEGSPVELIAGVSSNDTVGVNSTVAITEVGGSFAGLTYLPDGSGSNYEATIEISGFGAGQTLQSGMDIIRLAVTMEHSYLGDLEMILTCPSGDTSLIFNSFSGGGGGELEPGGFGGGGTYLGDAYDNNIGNPGIGWTYSFSDSIPDWGTLGQELTLGNTVPATSFVAAGNAMNPDSIYLPEESFDELIGCPINGVWKLVIRDNLSIDDGYIFDWAIFFNPFINPNFASYTSQLVSSQWYDDLGNAIGLSGDTIQLEIPDTAGFHQYRFEVFDDFGCQSDTVIEIYNTKRPLTTELDSVTCSNEVALEVNLADSVLWSVYFGDSANMTFFPSNMDTSVTATALETGIYRIDMSMFSNNCVFRDTAELIYVADLPLDLFADSNICTPAFTLFPLVRDTADVYDFEWGPNGETTDSLIVTETGMYYLTMSGCNIVSDSVFLALYEPPSIVGDYLVCDSSGFARINRENLGGNWSLASTTFNQGEFTYRTTIDSVVVASQNRGSIEVAYFDSICAITDTFSFAFQHMPRANILDSIICLKDIPYTLSATVFPDNNVGYTWTGGINDTVLEVYEPGIYALEVNNVCGAYEDTVHVKFKDCSYMIPNVLTPNGDGINDVFVIKNKEFYNSIRFQVYNRWGTIIKDAQDQTARWDGRTSYGELCPEGTYFYVIEIDGVIETGSITLITDH